MRKNEESKTPALWLPAFIRIPVVIALIGLEQKKKNIQRFMETSLKLSQKFQENAR